MKVSVIVRSTAQRRPLLQRVLDQLVACSDVPGSPTLEPIAVIDRGDDWVAPIAGVVTVRSPAGPQAWPTWKRIHLKYLTGFAAATGDWIVCADDDDWFEPERFVKLAKDANKYDVITAPGCFVHELCGARRTYLRKAPHRGYLETAIAFRRNLLADFPLVEDEMSVWLNRVIDGGVRHTRAAFGCMMFLHGTNADLGAGREGLRVNAVTGEVYDGPEDYTLIGGRDAAVAVCGEMALRGWEEAAILARV